MKTLLALALSLVAFNLFAAGGAQTGDAVKTFTSFLPVGSYSGSNDQGTACQVEVTKNGGDVEVRVIAGDQDLTKVITSGSQCFGHFNRKECTQVDHSQIGSDDVNYVEDVVRTVAANDGKQYVVVSHSVVQNTDSQTATAECVVGL